MANRRPPIDTPKTPIRKMVKEAADIWDVCEKDILGSSRFRIHTLPRSAVMLLAYDQGYSSTLIARRLNRLDHTTILSGRDVAKWRCEKDPEFGPLFAELKFRCKPPVSSMEAGPNPPAQSA